MAIRMTRRRFMIMTGAAAASGLLVACGDDDASDADSAEEDSAADAADDEEDEEVESSDDEQADDEGDADEGEPQPGGTLRIGQDFGPQELDPTVSGAWASTNIQELIFTALLRWNKDMEIENDLATDYELADETTYVFNLRENVTFHNGQDMTSQDVKYTFERILDPDVGSPRISLFDAVESVEAVDEYTVQFNLSRVSAPFIRYVATIPHGAIVPDGATEEELNAEAPGTGPFRFVEHVLDQEVRLEKFEDYYEEGLPYLDGVVFSLLGDDTSISSALESQSVDLTWLKDPRVAQNVADSVEGLESVPGVSSRRLPIYFDLTEPPFDDVNVRRALSVALNRSQLVEAVLSGFGSVGTMIPPSQLGGYEGDGSDLPYYTQDIEQAQELLAEAGHETLDIPEFKVVAANDLDVQCAQLMQEQWAQAGINVSVNPMEVGAILDDWSQGNYKMATVGSVWRPDPDAEVERMHSESPFGQNMGINDPDLDALIEEARVELDEDRRVEIYEEIQQHALDQVYVIVPYTYPLRWELAWDYVHGYEVMASNARLYVRQTWLSERE